VQHRLFALRHLQLHAQVVINLCFDASAGIIQSQVDYSLAPHA